MEGNSHLSSIGDARDADILIVLDIVGLTLSVQIATKSNCSESLYQIHIPFKKTFHSSTNMHIVPENTEQ